MVPVPACLNSSGELKDFILGVSVFRCSMLLGEWVISKTIHALQYLVMGYWDFFFFFNNFKHILRKPALHVFDRVYGCVFVL